MRLSGPPPRIDGALDDPAWSRIAPLAAFTQVAPVRGAVPTRRSELRLAYDGRTLYVALRAFDDVPGRIAARTLRRDADAIDGDDHVTLVLDVLGSGSHGFFFRVNALGAQRDGLVFDGGTAQPEWDAVWQAAGRIDAEGWSAELAIPQSALAVPADGRTWRFNVQRFVAATGERLQLCGAEAGRAVETLADAAPLQCVAPDAAGWGLRLRPGLRATHEQRTDGLRRQRLEPPLDAFWQATPGVTATLTLNTDFADAHLDDRQLNLSRFELFRAEKRAFFTQDAGRFAFGGLGGDEPDLLPFFSRRIGLGQALDAGVKLSGSAGPIEFGALAAQVDRAGRERTPRVGVLRVAGEVARSAAGDTSHRVGLIATQCHPEGECGSSLEGVDYQYRDTAWRGDDTLEANAWSLQSRNAGIGSSHAQGVSVKLPNYGPWLEASWRRLGERFLPPLGYVQEAGVEKADIGAGWWQRFGDGSSLRPLVFAGTRKRLDGSERSRYVGPNVEWASVQGDLVGVEAFAKRERIAVAFELLPGATVPAGEQGRTKAAVYAESSPSRALSGEAFLDSGGYYDGKRHEQFAALTWRPNAQWSLFGSGTRQDVRLASGRFVATAASPRLDHAASPPSQQSLVARQHEPADGVRHACTLDLLSQAANGCSRSTAAARDGRAGADLRNAQASLELEALR